MEQSNYFARSYLPINCNCYSCSCCFLCFIFCFNFASTLISLSFRQSLVLGAKISVFPSAAAASPPPLPFHPLTILCQRFETLSFVCVWKRTFQKKEQIFLFQFSCEIFKFSNFLLFFFFYLSLLAQHQVSGLKLHESPFTVDVFFFVFLFFSHF
ncbi:predicted protein [Lodderomyces elongisporus NRRL YB-4239]|uniref:Uncharacterized protein n=1 Tax=Lodderomyces elongisporus (strain ATCC 11503 / CBS 2605 / JCM 1781 / NBRC 1676 / NRRL YB-4239) TaxID=379508 RepID=A5E439_LODEL|nr:predicted protein [Lodderomyces elongisporus NRRL YB-4239]